MALWPCPGPGVPVPCIVPWLPWHWPGSCSFGPPSQQTHTDPVWSCPTCSDYPAPQSTGGNSHNAVVERLLRSSRDKRLSGGGEVFMIIECDLLKDARFVSSKFLRRPRKKRWLVINLRGAVECGPAAGKHDNKLSAEANVPQDEEADACSQYSGFYHRCTSIFGVGGFQDLC